MCSRADFLMTHAKDDETAYVLPEDTDPEDVEAIVPIAKYEGKMQELSDGKFRPNLPQSEKTEPGQQDEETNQFTRPAAGCDAEEANRDQRVELGCSRSPQQKEKHLFFLSQISPRQLLILATIMMSTIIVWRTSYDPTTDEDGRGNAEDEGIESVHVTENRCECCDASG